MAWQDIARSLAYGQSRKIACCGSGRTAYVSNSPQGIRFGPCFRCGSKEFEPHGPRTMAEILAARRKEEALLREREIPSRAVPMWDAPPEALQFILNGYLTPERATNGYGFRYDPEHQRVLMPVDGGFLARRVYGNGPKYIMAAPPSTSHYALLRPDQVAIAVVEDILSAIRIYECGYSALAVLGSSIENKTAMVVGDYATAIGWFDPDAGGDIAWKHLRRALALYDTRVVRVQSDKDPKAMWASEIKEKINDVQKPV